MDGKQKISIFVNSGKKFVYHRNSERVSNRLHTFGKQIRTLELCSVTSPFLYLVLAFRLKQTSKAQWLLYLPPSLTLKSSTFCCHTVFICFA